MILMTLMILMLSPPLFDKLEQTSFYWDATNGIGLNVGPLKDLLLNGVLCNLPLCILFVPDKLTVVKQPIETISQFIGDG